MSLFQKSKKLSLSDQLNISTPPARRVVKGLARAAAALYPSRARGRLHDPAVRGGVRSAGKVEPPVERARGLQVAQRAAVRVGTRRRDSRVNPDSLRRGWEELVIGGSGARDRRVEAGCSGGGRASGRGGGCAAPTPTLEELREEARDALLQDTSLPKSFLRTSG